MNIKKHIPNLFTLGNLLCGTLATIAAVSTEYEAVAILVLIGIVLDFFDGFIARILKVQGELGKQLDSLADMVTSGVVPGILMFKFYEDQLNRSSANATEFLILMAFTGFLLTLSAGYRLAKFNIDTRQSDSFIGLPTPAMSLFVVSLPIIYQETNIQFVQSILENMYFLVAVSLVLSFLMNANLPLLSLKFKNYAFRENIFKYLLILLSILMIVTLQYLAVPLIILVYILLSVIKNTMTKK